MILSRRNLLVGTGAIAASALAPAASAAQLKAIGLQLYTVRELFAKDPAGTLEKVARIGYREVEFGGGGYDAAKKVHGRKRHVATDTQGLLLDLLVTPASTQDRDGGRRLLWRLRRHFPTLRLSHRRR